MTINNIAVKYWYSRSMMIGTSQTLVFIDIILEHKISYTLVSFEQIYSHKQKIDVGST